MWAVVVTSCRDCGPIVAVPATYATREEAEAAAAARASPKELLPPPSCSVYAVVEVGGIPADASENR